MKKVVSLLLTVAMLCGCMSALAAYPVTCLELPSSVATESALGNVANDNSAYTFTYATVNAPDGASFVLLDKDETTGEYLMATNHSLVGDTFNYDTDATDGWQYNPEDEENVAYWVNTYLTPSGGGRALHYIGSDIRNHMVEKTWKIEAAPNQGLAERTITAKAVLPSYTEYKHYNAKLNSSKAYTNTNWYYIWLRTPSNDERDTAGTNMLFQLSTANSGMGGTGMLARRTATAGQGTNGIQLFFWVNADFFKDLKVGSIGSEVAKQIKADVTKAELKELGYTAEELNTYFGYAPDVVSVISNVELSVSADVPGGKTTVTYDAEPASDANTVAYYTCEADGSNPVKLDGVSGANAKIPSSAGGKYFCAGVISADGTVVYSEPVQIEAALPAYTSTSDLAEWTLDYNNPDYMFTTSYTNFTVLEEDGDEVVLLADRVDQGAVRVRPDNSNGGQGINSFDPAENAFFPTYMNGDVLSNDTTAWTQTNTAWQTGQVFGLPASIVPYVNTKALWRTEGLATAGIDEYAFEAAVTVPSATEILKYKDRIGIKGASQIAGLTTWTTRTPFALTNGNVQVFGTYGSTSATAQVTSLYMSANGYPRYIFRASKDFFKNQKLYVSGAADVHKKFVDMGSGVKAMLVANFARSEMKAAGYSEDELNAIGFSTAEPEVTKAEVQGTVSVAQTLTASYSYTDPNNSAISKVDYQWYYADTADGKLNKISGATSKDYEITSDMLGKYIAVGVRIYNAENVKSAEVKSVVAGPVADREDIIATPKSITDTRAEFVIDNAAAGKAMLMLYCVYDKTSGALVHFQPKDLTVVTGKDTYFIDVTDFTVTSNHNVKAMVWDSWNTMRPYAMIEK